jgi:hypothetical protein
MGITVCCLETLAGAVESRCSSCGPPTLCLGVETSTFRAVVNSADAGVSFTFAGDESRLAGLSAFDDRPLLAVFVTVSAFAGVMLVCAANGWTICRCA